MRSALADSRELNSPSPWRHGAGEFAQYINEANDQSLVCDAQNQWNRFVHFQDDRIADYVNGVDLLYRQTHYHALFLGTVELANVDAIYIYNSLDDVSVVTGYVGFASEL